MADLNALIAQGAQFRQPTDPFAQYGQLQKLESARQENALNLMKMDEYRRGIQEQNALRSSIASDFDINNPAHVNAILRASPTAGASFLEKFSQGAKERELAAKAKNEALKFNLDNSRSLLVGVNDQPSYDSWRAYSIKTMPELAQILPAQFSQESKSALLTTADDMSKKLTAAPSYQSVAAGSTLTKDGAPIYTAPAAPIKPPAKLEIMKALGYSMDAAGDAAYEAAKRAPPTAAALPADVATMKALGIPETPDGLTYFYSLKAKDEKPTDLVRNYEYAKKQGFKGSLFDYERNLKEAGRAPRPEPAPRTQQVTLSDGSLGIVNMDTGAITPSTLAGAPVKGKPSATAEKTAIQRKQLGFDLDRAIIELTDVIKEGGLIDQSTGSGAGRLVDLAAGFGGKATPGAIAIGKLQPIADLALKMVPRFEGPQSNADTTSYKQAAGQLADATLPREIRKEAAKTVLRLMKSRKDQFASPEMAAEGVAPAPAASSIRDQADAILRGGS